MIPYAPAVATQLDFDYATPMATTLDFDSADMVSMLPACFAPDNSVAVVEVTDSVPVQTTKVRKKAMKKKSVEGTATSAGTAYVRACISGNRAEVTMRQNGQRTYLFTLTKAGWGDTFEKDAKDMADWANTHSMSIGDMKLMHKKWSASE